MKVYRTTSNHYFVKDDNVKIKVARGFSRTVTITGGEFDGIYDIDYGGTVYDSSNREWNDDRGTFFYPHASFEAVSYINRALESINNNN